MKLNLIAFLVLFFGLLTSTLGLEEVNAECIPNECGRPGINFCGPDDICQAHCCIDTGGSGGGGGSCQKVCNGTDCDKEPSGCSNPTNNECNNDCDCGAPCGTPPPSPSCTVTLSPTLITITTDSTQLYTASVTPANGTVSQVNFTSSSTSVATVSPASDSSSPYRTTATAQSAGSTNVRAGVIMGGSERCSTTAVLNVIPPQPWWEAIDSDIFTAGNITSAVPAALRLILDGLGGFPGVAGYGGSLSLGNGSLSSTNWGINTILSERKTYSYATLTRQIPSDVVMNEIASPVIDGSELVSGGAQSKGYYWYHFDGSLGDLTITDNITIPGDRKVVLLVDGANLILNGQVRIGTKGVGFFVALVGKNESGNKGDIVVDEVVGGTGDGIPELEGIYLADGSFSTGTAGADLDTQLHIRGSVSGYGGVNLQRDLIDDSATPAELFEFAPDLLLLYPPSLGVSKFSWEEVAP